MSNTKKTDRKKNNFFCPLFFIYLFFVVKISIRILKLPTESGFDADFDLSHRVFRLCGIVLFDKEILCAAPASHRHDVGVILVSFGQRREYRGKLAFVVYDNFVILEVHALDTSVHFAKVFRDACAAVLYPVGVGGKVDVGTIVDNVVHNARTVAEFVKFKVMEMIKQFASVLLHYLARFV